MNPGFSGLKPLHGTEAVHYGVGGVRPIKLWLDRPIKLQGTDSMPFPIPGSNN